MGQQRGPIPLRNLPSDPAAVMAELTAVLSSETFVRPERLRRFLKFVVEETIAGRMLNEYRIAVEVYDRKSSFDPASDSIVRVEVSRLRQKLAEFYRTEGRDRRLVIDVPPRSYVPVFRAKPNASNQVLASPLETSAPPPADEPLPKSTPRKPFLTFDVRPPPAMTLLGVLALGIVGALIWSGAARARPPAMLATAPRSRSRFCRSPTSVAQRTRHTWATNCRRKSSTL